MYRIKDLQIEGRYFWEGHRFKNKEEMIEALACYHDIDYIGEDDQGNEYYDIWKFLDTLKTASKQLNWLLDYGQWEVEKCGRK